MSSSIVFQHLRLWDKSHVRGPHIRLAMLDDVTSGLTGNRSDLNYIPIVSHPVDHLENGRKI